MVPHLALRPSRTAAPRDESRAVVGIAHVTADRIAEETGLHRKKVRRALAKLQRRGYVYPLAPSMFALTTPQSAQEATA